MTPTDDAAPPPPSVCDPVPLFDPQAASVPSAAAPKAPPSSRRRVKADAFAIFVSFDMSTSNVAAA